MSVKYNILKRLETGQIVSGEEFAKEFSVSRNAVWKAINSLRKDGYKIDGQTNSGYKMISFGDVLTKETIGVYLKTDNLDLHVYDTIGSTNTHLKAWAGKGYKEGTVVVSKEQTQGKGRMGRSFESPNETGVYISVLLRPKFSAQESLMVTTSAAVAVATAIEELSGKETKIKWVNDIFIGNKKVSGILTEASINFETGGLEFAVLGIGINLKEPENGFSQSIKNIAGGIFDAELPSQMRAKMVATVLDNFFKIYVNLPNNDFIEQYRKRSYLTGKEVAMTVGQSQEKGIVVDIDKEARLLVKLSDGEIKAFSAGEALIKKQ